LDATAGECYVLPSSVSYEIRALSSEPLAERRNWSWGKCRDPLTLPTTAEHRESYRLKYEEHDPRPRETILDEIMRAALKRRSVSAIDARTCRTGPSATFAGMVAEVTKLKWFDAGVEAFSLQRDKAPQALLAAIASEPMYVCPLCVQPFPRSAVLSGELTAEHVPPDCFDGGALVLTCKKCNNTAGTRLDAHAYRKEAVEEVLLGVRDRVQNVSLIVGDARANVELTASNGEFEVRFPRGVNPPGTEEQLRGVLGKGSTIVVDFSRDRFADLGAKISWLRSGYLLLFAVFGYGPVFDPVLDSVRRQIAEPETALMRTFTIELPDRWSWAEKRLIKVLEADHGPCWAVQFGRYLVLFPLAGDASFYERVGREMAGRRATIRGEPYEWPDRPFPGLDVQQPNAASGPATG
jgi:hypothetical protein